MFAIFTQSSMAHGALGTVGDRWGPLGSPGNLQIDHCRAHMDRAGPLATVWHFSAADRLMSK